LTRIEKKGGSRGHSPTRGPQGREEGRGEVGVTWGRKKARGGPFTTKTPRGCRKEHETSQ